MAQKTFVDGDVLTASDINTYLMGEGGAWTSFTPTVTQSGSVTVTNTRSTYARYGRTIHFSINLDVQTSGTGSNDIVIGGLPATAAAADMVVGTGRVYDASSGGFGVDHFGQAYLASTTTIRLRPAANSLGNLGSVAFTAGLANGDKISLSGTYEAAS
jgi:hypothetical protein